MMPKLTVTPSVKANPAAQDVNQDVDWPTHCVEVGHVKKSTPADVQPQQQLQLWHPHHVHCLGLRVVQLLAVQLQLNVAQD